MVLPQEQKFIEKLNKRKQENAFRTLDNSTNEKVDFLSNDYLGLSKLAFQNQNKINKHGATGSRLISGNHEQYPTTESFLSTFYNAPSALIYNSGYTANIGLLSAILQKDDVVLYDEYCHASIKDGLRLSFAKCFSFNHNNVQHLKNKIKSLGKVDYLIVESIYSMDGDEAPLKTIDDICKANNIALIVDEAHAVGVVSKNGLVSKLGLEHEVFARVVTFGKAIGTHGAAVLSSKNVRDYLINFSRPFIYTTALPPYSVWLIKKMHEHLDKNLHLIDDLKQKIELFKEQIKGCKFPVTKSNSAIQSIIIPGNNEVKNIADILQKAHFLVKPIRYPTVPKGKERIRICLHTFNTSDEIISLTKLLKSI